MARTDGLLHLFGRHSFPRSALEAMMSASTDDRVRGENPVNHGMAVLLEVEALVTDRGRGQHERPEGRTERLTHNTIGLNRAQPPRGPRAPTSYTGAPGRRPARGSRCRVGRGCRSAASRGQRTHGNAPRTHLLNLEPRGSPKRAGTVFHLLNRRHVPAVEPANPRRPPRRTAARAAKTRD
jgi:hypothetical protein